MTLAIMEDWRGRTWRLLFDGAECAQDFAEALDLDIVSLSHLTREESNNIVEIEY